MALTLARRSTALPARNLAAPTPVTARRMVVARFSPQLLSTLAEVGDVDAPIGVVVGAAIVVSLAATALVPLALNPGQQAANKIFKAEQQVAPLDKKPAAKASAKKK